MESIKKMWHTSEEERGGRQRVSKGLEREREREREWRKVREHEAEERGERRKEG